MVASEATLDLRAEEYTPLTALDLCDQCGFSAYYRVKFQGGELLFCAHHGHVYLATPQRNTGPVTIIDETYRLKAGVAS